MDMKSKKIVVKILGGAMSMLAVLSANAETATKVTMELSTGTQTYTMYDGGKMYFSDDNIVVDATGDGSGVASNALSKVNKIVFSTIEISGLGDEKVLATSPSVSVYPNPVGDNFSLQTDLQGDFVYTIYNLGGGIVKTGKTQNGVEIDASAMKSGVYLLEVEKSYLKFTKK